MIDQEYQPTLDATLFAGLSLEKPRSSFWRSLLRRYVAIFAIPTSSGVYVPNGRGTGYHHRSRG